MKPFVPGHRNLAIAIPLSALLVALFVSIASAWTVSKPIVTAICKAPINASSMYVHGTLTNLENTASGDMIVTMKTIYGSDTHTVLHNTTMDFYVPTGLEKIPAGTATFSATWLNGRQGTDTFPTVSFDAGACQPVPPVVQTPTTPVTPVTPTPVAQTPAPVDTGNPVAASASIGITKTGPSKAKVLKDIVYKIVLRNTGNIDATDVVLTDTLPSGMSFVRSDHNGSFVNGKFVSKIGTLKAHAKTVISVILKANANTHGNRTNKASASASNAKSVRDSWVTQIIRVITKKPQPAVTG